jgi:hypothetical protein
MFVAPEIFRSILGVRTQIFTKAIMRIEPRHDRRVKAAAGQGDDLRKTVALPGLESGAETVPAESGADAPMQLAVLYEQGRGVVRLG